MTCNQFRTRPETAGRLLRLIVGLIGVAALRTQAGAVCNVIPGPANSFQGAHGTADRPFARPGDPVRISLESECDVATGSPNLFRTNPAGNVVTIAFKPAQGAARLVVLAAGCGATPVCGSGAASPCCIQANVPGERTTIAVGDRRHLEFRFPDTDAMVLDPSDLVTLTGPAAIAVTIAGDPLPTALATATCANVGGTVACVDALFADDGTCGNGAHSVFPHFTALPPANDFQAICTEPVPPCTGASDEIRFTVDVAGNLLVPMNWRGVLVPAEIPVGRFLRAESPLEAFAGQGVALRLPRRSDVPVVTSYAMEGGRVEPVFDPQVDPNAPDELTLFGTADEREGLLRIARLDPLSESPVCVGGTNGGEACADHAQCPGGICYAPRCIGGTNDALACSIDADCPGGECGPGLFEFRDRLVDGIGPVLLRRGHCVGGSQAENMCIDDASCPAGQCGRFTAKALDPVSLDGLSRSEEINAYVTAEGVADRDLNGDGDLLDDAIQLIDRVTGIAQSIGDLIYGSGPQAGQPAPARAVVRAHAPPFSFPAMAVDGDVLAFLESESSHGYRDVDDNGKRVEAILRVFKLGFGEVTLSSPAPPDVDPALVLNGRSLVLSPVSGREGVLRLFYRHQPALGSRQGLERITKTPRTSQNFCVYSPASLSDDGRYVAYGAACKNQQTNQNLSKAAFVFDRQLQQTTQVPANASGVPIPAAFGAPDGLPPNVVLSGDGRWVGLVTRERLVAADTDDTADVYVFDRATNATELLTIGTEAAQVDQKRTICDLSPDGRVALFWDGGPLYVRDRQSGSSAAEVVASATTPNPCDVGPASMSSDARLVVFEQRQGALDRVLLRDRVSGETIQLSDSEGSCWAPAISRDGNSVAFRCLDGSRQVVVGFELDPAGDWLQRLDVATGGLRGSNQDPSGSYGPSLSRDGRLTVFASNGTNLVPGDTNGQADVFLHDRLTRTTERVSTAMSGAQLEWASGGFTPSVVSADGRTVVFVSKGALLPVPGEAVSVSGEEIFARSFDLPDDPGAPFSEGSGDGAVLEVAELDASTPSAATVQTLCPSAEVSVAAGRAAFLRPESAAGTVQCPAGSLNGDADIADDVVHLWAGGAMAQNLGRAATAVALSENWVAALVSESGDGQNYNPDGDRSDQVVQVREAGGGGNWRNSEMAASKLAIAGNVVAFTVPEAAQGVGSLNSRDADTDDEVMHAYLACSSWGPPPPGYNGYAPPCDEPINLRQSARDFVLGASGLIAFRTSEAAEGRNTSLNSEGGDTDSKDDVLQVYSVFEGGDPFNTGRAVTPCRLEACDPRVPYRVLDHTVRFLTFECDQGGTVKVGCPTGGTDINGDGDAGDLVLQILNVAKTCHDGTAHGACYPIAAVPMGVCTTTSTACVKDIECPDRGICFVPQGGCARQGGACSPTGTSSGCSPDERCRPLLGQPGLGVCERIKGACEVQADCPSGSTCNANGLTLNRLANALGTKHETGVLITGQGRCIEDFGTPCDAEAACPNGEFCRQGTCHREYGSCAKNADCPAGSSGEPVPCQSDLVTQGMADGDRDEVPDRFDNCATIANPNQADGDADGRGDACDTHPEGCGNGSLDLDERCDDGNHAAGDGCSPTCTVERTSCPERPIAGCRTLGDGGSSSMTLRRGSLATGNQLVWSWKDRADQTTSPLAQFGIPTANTTYAMCLYREDGPETVPLAAMEVPIQCGNGPCWRSRAGGFQYKAPKGGAPHGIQTIKLSARAGEVAINLRAKGAHLQLPGLPLPGTPLLRTQLIASNADCWDVSFAEPSAHTPTTLKVRAP